MRYALYLFMLICLVGIIVLGAMTKYGNASEAFGGVSVLGYSVGDSMPDYMAGTVDEGERNVLNIRGVPCWAFIESYYDTSAEKLYLVVTSITREGTVFTKPSHGLPYVIRVSQFKEGTNILEEVFLVDVVSKSGKKKPDGVIDEIFVRSSGEVLFDTFFKFHPKRIKQ